MDPKSEHSSDLEVKINPYQGTPLRRPCAKLCCGPRFGMGQRRFGKYSAAVSAMVLGVVLQECRQGLFNFAWSMFLPEELYTPQSRLVSASKGNPDKRISSNHAYPTRSKHKYYGFDDALYVAVRFLDSVAKSGQSVAELRDSLPQMVNTPEVRFDCDDTRKFEVVDEVVATLRAAGADFSDIDGARVSTPDGWWLIRASNTQPVLVARCEAADEAGLARLKTAVKEALAPCGVTPPSDF